MSKFFAVVLLLVLMSGCASTEVVISPSEPSIQNVDNPGTVLSPNTAADAPTWVESDIDGIDIGVWMPAGWQYDETSGLTLLEHMTTLNTGSPRDGIRVYFFVPALESLVDSDASHDNLAYAALHEVANTPHLTGNARLNAPKALAWGDVDCAYYTYVAPNGVKGLVMAFAVPGEARILAVNISAPSADSGRLADLIPLILGDLRINRQRIGSEPLSMLPELLSFPEREAG